LYIATIVCGDFECGLGVLVSEGRMGSVNLATWLGTGAMVAIALLGVSIPVPGGVANGWGGRWWGDRDIEFDAGGNWLFINSASEAMIQRPNSPDPNNLRTPTINKLRSGAGTYVRLCCTDYF
jgi:hypothetical protein